MAGKTLLPKKRKKSQPNQIYMPTMSVILTGQLSIGKVWKLQCWNQNTVLTKFILECVCVCVCVCVCLYTCTCVCVCMSMYLCLFLCACAYVWPQVYLRYPLCTAVMLKSPWMKYCYLKSNQNILTAIPYARGHKTFNTSTINPVRFLNTTDCICSILEYFLKRWCVCYNA